MRGSELLVVAARERLCLKGQPTQRSEWVGFLYEEK